MFFFNEPNYDNLPSYQELGAAGAVDVGSTMFDTFMFEDLSNSKTRNLDNAKWQDVVKAQRAAPELFIEGYEKPELIEGSGHAIDIINQARKETYQLQTGIRVSDYDDIVAPNIEKLKELDPEIRNISEIDQAIIDKAKELREKYEKTAARASAWDAFWGSLGGGALGAMADPINIMTMPIGLGATSLTGGLLRGIATAFGKTAAIGMGAEAAIQPFIYDYKKEIDSPYELGDALMNIAFAGVGEGILGGTGHVILRGFKRLGDKGEITNAQQRVGDYIKQIQDIADNNEVFTAKQLEAHVEALVTIEKDIREGRIPDIKQLNERIERIYLEDFGKVIHGTQAEIVELSAKRQELAQRFREDVYQQQKEWQSKFDGRMRPDEVEQAKSVQGSAYIGNKPGISLKAVRGAQKADWESGEAGVKLDAHNEAVDAHLSFKGSRKAHGDQVKLKERLGEMDVQLEAKTKYLDAAKKAREVYLKTQAEKARKAIPDAPTDNVKQKAFKQLVNRMLANMGATNIKVNVFNGSMPGVSPNARFSLDNGKGSPAWEAAKAKGLDMSHEARMERARAMGFDVDNIMYHGSHDFGENIDLDYYGSGEGGQGYGYGFHVSKSKNTADNYSKSLKSFTVDGEEIYANDKRFSVLEMLHNNGFDDSRKILKEIISQNPDLPFPRERLKLLENLNSKSITYNEIPKRIYSVYIPQDDQFLDFNKTLANQSEFVKGVLRDHPALHFDDDMLGKNIYYELAEDLGGEFDGDLAAATNLNDLGIKGTKYFDDLASGYYGNITKKQKVDGGDFNYSVFDPTNIRSVNAAFDPDLIGSPNLRFSLSEGAVSTRVPTAKSSTEDALKEDLLVGLDTDLSDPVTLEKNATKIGMYENYKPQGDNETPEEVARNFIQHVKDNLLWLHSLVPEGIRERSHMWYTGANRITETLAGRYGYTSQQAAGVMAVLSPQKDWYMNASLGERVMEVFTNHKNTPWSPEMELVAADPTMAGSGKTKAPKGILARNEKNKKLYESIKGKTLGELEGDLEIAAWVRVYDEAHHNRGHRVVTPEGDFVDFATTKNGTHKVTGWGSFSEIAKAISVLRDGTPSNISAQMGGMHKVRNFYNNILIPDSPNGHVTIDTHAVAAGLLKPLAGNHLEVGHNFGTGAASSSKTGSKGTYGLYAEAYRQAAEEVGILPRQMQSITWEAIRGFFSPAFKGKKSNQALINGIWQDYKDGKISLDQAREVIHEKANGIEDPTWHRPDSDLADKKWLSSYKTGVFRGSISRDHELAKASRSGVGDDAARRNTNKPTVTRNSIDSGRVEAAIDPETGELHLNIDAFESDEHLMRVLREEVIGHYGLRQTLGKQFGTVINDIKSVAYHNKELRQAWIDLSGVDPRTKQVINKEAPYAGMADEVIADELISKLAREEMTFSETTMAKLMSMLTKALRAVGLVKDPITMSEMKALVIKSERQLKKGATKNNTPITMTGLSNKSNPDADKPLEEILESEANATLKGEDEGVVMIDINGKEVNYYDSLKESQRQLDALDTLEICAL